MHTFFNHKCDEILLNWKTWKSNTFVYIFFNESFALLFDLNVRCIRWCRHNICEKCFKSIDKWIFLFFQRQFKWKSGKKCHFWCSLYVGNDVQYTQMPLNQIYLYFSFKKALQNKDRIVLMDHFPKHTQTVDRIDLETVTETVKSFF